MQVHGANWQGSCQRITKLRRLGFERETKMGMRPSYAGRHVPVTQHEAPMHSDNASWVGDRLLLLATSDRYPPFQLPIDTRW